MERALAETIVDELLKADEMGTLLFDIEVVFGLNDIVEGFHPWADGKEHIGVFKLSVSQDESYYLVFIDWREGDNYYVVIFDSNRNRPLAELHKVVGGNESFDLCWSYKPTKRDDKNILRKDYFKRCFGDINVRIPIPQQITEVDLFLQDIITLAKNRVKADELDSTLEHRDGFPEGRTLERLHKLKERNSKVTKLAKQNAKQRFGKLECEVCGFNFADFYGDLGTDYIEAHHTIPVSELEEDHITKVEEIALVCCNCHQMLHRSRPWLKITELKKILSD